MLALVPHTPDRWRDVFTYMNLGVLRRRYGATDIRSTDALLTPKNADFINARDGCYASDFAGWEGSDAKHAAFGFNIFDVDGEISAGRSQGAFAHLEGAFDAAAITAKLQGHGYARAMHSGVAFLTVRQDSEAAPPDDRTPEGRARIFALYNRLAVTNRRVIAAPQTALITDALDAERRASRTLADDPRYRALAAVLGDVTSAATSRVTPTEAVVADPERFARLSVGWGRLRHATLAAMGYTDRGQDNRLMHVALVYANPADAEADAPELARRLRGYRYVAPLRPEPDRIFFPEAVTAITTHARTVAGYGVLVADCALTTAKTEIARFNPAVVWARMIARNDVLFLVPDPAVAPFTGP